MLKFTSQKRLERKKYANYQIRQKMRINKKEKKRFKISEKKHRKNAAYKAKIKTTIKNFDSAIQENKLDNAKASYQRCVSILDKAVQKGILAKNTVARKKSILSKKLFGLTRQFDKEVKTEKEQK